MFVAEVSDLAMFGANRFHFCAKYGIGARVTPENSVFTGYGGTTNSIVTKTYAATNDTTVATTRLGNS